MNFDGMKNGIHKAFQGIADYARDCKELDDYLAKQRLEDMRQTASQAKRAALEPEHERFANALGACLQRNYEKYGLKRPVGIEDVLCDNDADDICPNGQNLPDFVYEAERGASSAGIWDIGKHSGVPVEAIEEELKRTLPKYAKRRGYQFNDIIVDEIPDTRKIKITVQGVNLTPGEIQRRGLMY